MPGERRLVLVSASTRMNERRLRNMVLLLNGTAGTRSTFSDSPSYLSPSGRAGSSRISAPGRAYPVHVCRHGQVPEMRDCAVVDPERNRSRSLHSGLEVVDDERRLFLTVDVEACAVATHVNPDRRPHVRQKVDIRFVPGRRFPAKPEPRPIRV